MICALCNKKINLFQIKECTPYYYFDKEKLPNRQNKSDWCHEKCYDKNLLKDKIKSMGKKK